MQRESGTSRNPPTSLLPSWVIKWISLILHIIKLTYFFDQNKRLFLFDIFLIRIHLINLCNLWVINNNIINQPTKWQTKYGSQMIKEKPKRNRRSRLKARIIQRRIRRLTRRNRNHLRLRRSRIHRRIRMHNYKSLRSRLILLEIKIKGMPLLRRRVAQKRHQEKIRFCQLMLLTVNWMIRNCSKNQVS